MSSLMKQTTFNIWFWGFIITRPVKIWKKPFTSSPQRGRQSSVKSRLGMTQIAQVWQSHHRPHSHNRHTSHRFFTKLLLCVKRNQRTTAFFFLIWKALIWLADSAQLLEASCLFCTVPSHLKVTTKTQQTP